MHAPPPPANETERLAALRRFEVLDSLPEQAFDDITFLASTICQTPIATITLVDAERQWFKSRVGLQGSETGRDLAFCAYAILEPGQVLVVEDATNDPRFRDNPLVKGEPEIRFYAGAPIVTSDGYALGTVCVIDRVKRHIDEAQVEALRSLSRLVINLLESEKARREETRRDATNARRQIERLTALVTEGLELKSFVDRDYVCIYVNQTYLNYWRLTREEVEGARVVDLVGEPAFSDQVKPHLDAALMGDTVSSEASYAFPSRGLTHIEVTYLPARDSGGAIIGVVVRVQDIHKLREREEQLLGTVAMLEHKSLEQQRFIHMVSHDLSEPINTIVNFSKLLSEELTGEVSSSCRQYLGFVRKGGERMKLLLDDLINLMRLDGHAVGRRPVDLNSVMAEVLADLDLAISRSGGRVECGELPAVMGDHSLLRILLQNLVANAIKFARSGVPPVIRVECSSTAEAHEITVKDNGIGIPATHLESVFDMFTRLNSRRRFEGTGLGLSISRRIAEMHDGRITATSEPGKGSCFTLQLSALHAALTKETENAIR